MRDIRDPPRYWVTHILLARLGDTTFYVSSLAIPESSLAIPDGATRTEFFFRRSRENISLITLNPMPVSVSYMIRQNHILNSWRRAGISFAHT